MTGVLNSSAVSGAAAVAMQKNRAEIPSESFLSTTLALPGLTTTHLRLSRHRFSLSNQAS